MNICFFGMGSIGARHIKNLHEICKKRNISVNIDVFRSSDKKLDKDVISLINNQVYCEDELKNRYDAIFITNPTDMHFDTILKNKERSKNFFIEKPVFEKRYDLRELSLSTDGIYYVACPLRYSKVILKIKDMLDENNASPFSIRAISSSYLPDWRPGTDYRKTYSAHKDQGGGVSIDLIHELDYLTYLFGMPKEVLRCIGKYSNLEIDSDDLAVYICKYKDKIIEIHLDYFGRAPKREVELYFEDKIVVGDLINNKITIANDETIFDEQPNDKYVREIEYFIDCVYNKEKSHNEIDHAQNVLALSRGDI